MQQHVSSSKENTRMKVIPGGNQMSLIRDTEEVIKFLEFVGRKSILQDQAVQTRLTACHNLFSVITEEEDNTDYILKNLDVITNRFRNKNGNVQASTLKVYKSRVKSSLEDYKAWSSDPFLWERSLTDKAKKAVAEEVRKEKKSKTAKAEPAEVAEVPEETSSGYRKVTFPVRTELQIEMTLPIDGLTLKELQKIVMFLYPYCKDIEESPFPWQKQ